MKVKNKINICIFDHIYVESEALLENLFAQTHFFWEALRSHAD